MKNKKTLEMVQMAVLIAIILIMAITPLGYLRTGGLEISLMTVPVVIGAMSVGPGCGAVLGLAFGLTSFYQCFGMSAFGAALLNINPFLTFLVCVPTRALMGYLRGVLFRAMYKVDKTKTVSYFAAALLGAFMNTLFFMGMLWFSDQKAEAVVLETGMGGRLDATNVVRRPAVCVITRIGMDHMEYLGDTKEKIAAEKAGIIKPHVPVVFWDEEPSVSRVIVEKAKKNGAETVPVSEQEVGFFNFKNKTVDFSMRSGYYEYIRVCLHTPAVYQRQNAALAVRALEVLNRKLTKEGSAAKRISREAIEEGLSAAHWSGRMEEVLPGVVIDGAHNEDGVSAFLESVQRDGCEGRRSLLFSVVSDKRAERMAEQILKSGLFSRIAAAPMESGRSVTKEQLDNIWKGRAELHDSPEEAFATLIGARGEKDMVYAAGSLYLAGQLLACGKND